MAEGKRDHLRVQLVQLAVDKNVQTNIERMKGSIDGDADFVILPELWNVPYDNGEIQKAYKYEKDCYLAMSLTAKENGVWLAGTIPYAGKNMAFVFDDGGHEVCRYAKAHLMEVHTKSHDYTERDVFEAGDEFCAFDTPWGRFGILICYDIRFPEPARLLALKGVRLLVVCAAFNNKVGPQHWEILLRCRALENELWVCGVNPVYKYGNYEAWGHSMIVDPNGQIKGTGPGVYDVDLTKVDEIRCRMPYWKIRRDDLYTLEDNHETNTDH